MEVSKLTALEIYKMMIQIPQNAPFAPFLQKKIDQLEAKAARAHKYKRRKKLETNGTYKDLILQAISEYPQTSEQIAAILAFADPDISREKIVPRLNALIKEGVLKKDHQRINGNKTIVYSLNVRKETE